MDFSLTDEQRAIQETAREFARREVDPIVDEIDEAQKFPREVMKKAGELGFLGIIFPEEYGGAGLGYVEYAIVIDELSRVDPLGRHQRRRPQLALHQPHLQVRQRGAAASAGCAPLATRREDRRLEPDRARTPARDAAGTRTTAPRRWTAAGSSTAPRPSAPTARVGDVCVVMAVTDAGRAARHNISAFVVEKGTPGFRPGKKENKLGMRASRHRRSDPRGLPRPRRTSCSARWARASCRRCRSSTAAASRSPRSRSAWRRAPTRRRSPTPRSASSSASRSPIPGDPVRSSPTWRREIDAAAAADLSRRPWLMDRGRQGHASRPRMAKLFAGEAAVFVLRARRADPRRLRLHQGLPGREVLPRRQALHHRRGHQRDPAPGDRAAVAQGLRPVYAGPPAPWPTTLLDPPALGRQPRALGRAISAVEDGGDGAARAARPVYRRTGRARWSASPARPGAGKSTLVDRLARLIRRRGRDRRRSSPSIPPARSPAAPSSATASACRRSTPIPASSSARWPRAAPWAASPAPPRDAVDLLDAAGLRLGAGRDRRRRAGRGRRRAHASTPWLVVTVPGLGDDIQAIKAGILEIADVFVINKADREGVERTARDLEMMLSIGETRRLAAADRQDRGLPRARGSTALLDGDRAPPRAPRDERRDRAAAPIPSAAARRDDPQGAGGGRGGPGARRRSRGRARLSRSGSTPTGSPTGCSPACWRMPARRRRAVAEDAGPAGLTEERMA